MKTVNRGTLLKLARAGKLVMVESYSFDDQAGASQSTRTLPVRIIEHADQWQDGFCNLFPHAFRGKAGRAWEEENGDICLYIHSNHNVTLRKKG